MARRGRTNGKLTTVIEREGTLYVARCLEFDVASQGVSVEEAKDNLLEALELFVEHAPPEEQERRYRRAVE